MAEFTSSQKLSANNAATSSSNINAKTKTFDNKNSHLAEIQFNLEKDTFKSTNTAKNAAEQNNLSNPFLKEVSSSAWGIKENIYNPIINIPNTVQQTTLTSLSAFQTNANQLLNEYLSKFINIMDKIAAVYGEKEKDIRDKLSDTFKQLKINVFDALGPVDTSLKQQDHHKEKKTKEHAKKSEDADTFAHELD
ncbi:MAG TPA: hypothetical protein P5556_11165 [Candidatus Gastranaerophilales bacterium]|nr:hypothetical protein [Candidatus Gastranaerophilales bacterium]